ncbi:adenine nucleotide alpha hydrolase [Rufibacter immobilis]|uniref:Adenine nucleotide alpha hydrolase n=1 Tax=Rufibacter immobilis TaxID=1348778 RepID=A0A3M9MYX5_9BACT|nr:adenine nucleotide alpha hydrolase [Rufibacter immobilis]RNI30375.1 adenine nucleotide alpha hydrolase [Rufibacter immobilis]
MKSLAIFNWSGGKDSALALYRVQQQPQFQLHALFTTVSQIHQRVTMHGVREELMQAQAQALDLPWQPLYLPENTTMSQYNQAMAQAWTGFKAAGVTHGIFGDLYLEDLREYRETQLRSVGIQAHFPLWGERPVALLEEFWQAGFKAKVVCVNGKHLDASFAGRELDEAFVRDLPAMVDPCGENGEYHSFVYDGPNFRQPVPVQIGEVVFRSYAPATPNQQDTCFQADTPAYDTGFWFCDLLLSTGKEQG